MANGTLAKVFSGRNELIPRNIRGGLWAAILAFPLSVILGDLRYFDLRLELLGLQSYELMLFPLGLGWLVLFFLPKRLIIPALRLSAVLCAIILPFQLLMEAGNGRFAFFMAFQFLNGVCAGAAFFIFCFALNNVERFFGMAFIQLYYGFFYTFWRNFPSVAAFGKAWGGVIVMAVYLAAVFRCRPKEGMEIPDVPNDSKDTAVPLILGLNVVYYLIMCMINYVEWADDHVNSWAFGIGSFASVALVIVIHLFIQRSALYSWLLFLVLSLLGLGALLSTSRAAVLSGSFAYGLGDGLGYIIIYYICAGAIKQGKSLKMYRLYCLVLFAEYFVISGILTKGYELYAGQSNILAFGIVIILCCISFLLFPVLQRKLFDAPWTDSLRMADMAEYAPALAQTERLDEQEHLGLSPREKEIFILLLTDMSRKQIASTLKVSYSAVDFHIRNLYRKIGVQSRVELFAKYGKHTPNPV